MASGAARVWTNIYLNDANIDFDCSASGYYRLVLRLTEPAQDVTGQTVRAVLKGPLTAGYPGLTESYQDIFEVSIAKVYSNGSTLTITDDRKFLRNVSLPFRQGGDSTKWSTAGTNKYATIGVNIQCGAVDGTGFSKDSAYKMVWPSQNGAQVVPASDYTGLCFIQAKSDGTVPLATVLTLSSEWDSYGVFNAPSAQTYLESVMFMVVGQRYG